MELHHHGIGGETNPELPSGSSEMDDAAGIHVDSTVNEDSLRAMAGVAVAAHAASTEDTPVPVQQAPLPTKEEYLHNELNPPLVAATLIQSEPTVDPVTILQWDQEQQSAPQVVSQHQPRADMSFTDVVRVYVDDEPSTPNQQDEEEKKMKRRVYWKVFLVSVTCIIVGACIGLVVGYNGGLTVGYSGGGRRDDVSRSVTVSPSASPSCKRRGIDAVWAEGYADDWSWEQPLFDASVAYSNMAFASKAHVSHSSNGETLLVLQSSNSFYIDDTYYEESTLVTLILNETGLKKKFVQTIENIIIFSMALSDDGMTLAVGVDGYSGGDSGGSLLLFRQSERWGDLSWNLTHTMKYTGACPYDVAINDDGTVVAAAILGVFDSYLVVYRVKMDTLEALGDRLLDNSVDTTNTDLKLSGDGARLFAATTNSTITILDFSTQGGWSLNESLLFADSSTGIQISRDGKTVAPTSSYFPFRLYEFTGSTWRSVEISSDLGELGQRFSASPPLITLSREGKTCLVTLNFDSLNTPVSGSQFRGNETVSDDILTTFFNQTEVFTSVAQNVLGDLVDPFQTDAQFYGHLFKKDERDTSVLVEDSALSFQPGLLRSALLMEDGSILVATNDDVQLFRSACSN